MFARCVRRVNIEAGRITLESCNQYSWIHKAERDRPTPRLMSAAPTLCQTPRQKFETKFDVEHYSCGCLVAMRCDCVCLVGKARTRAVELQRRHESKGRRKAPHQTERVVFCWWDGSKHVSRVHAVPETLEPDRPSWDPVTVYLFILFA